MALSLTHSNLPYPVRKARFSLLVEYRDTAGALTNPTGPDSEVSADGGASFADCTEEVSPTAGHGYLTLTGAETDNAALKLQCKGTGVLTATFDLYPRDLPIYTTGTAQAGANSSITLAAGASAVDDYYNGAIVRTTGGTGGGGTGGADNQARVITDYNGTTKVATISGTWEVNPSSDTTYDMLQTEEFTAKLLERVILALPAVAPDSSGGLATEDANGNIAVDVARVSGDADAADNLELAYDGTGYAGGTIKPQVDLVSILGTALTETAGQIAAAFKKFFNVATPTGTVNSIPDAVAGGTGGIAIVGSNMGTVTGVTGNVSGSVGSVTGAVGSVTGAVGSVSGNVGGNVTGSVGSVAGDVGGKVLGGGSGTITGIGAWALGSAGAALAAAATFTGITALANWLRAIIRSDTADATALSEINATGGAYDEAKASLQAASVTQVEELAALSEAQGILDKVDTMLEAGGAVYRFTANALAQAPTGDAPTAEEIAGAVDTELSDDFDIVTQGLNAIALSASAAADSAADAAADAAIAATTAAKLDTALEADGAVYRWTANALEEAPSGSVVGGTIIGITASGYTLSADQVDLEVYRGDDVSIEFQIYSDAAQTTAYDLTGATLTWTAKLREHIGGADDTTAVIQKTMTLDADPTTGQATVTLDGQDTEDLETDLAMEWDICIVESDGDIRTGGRGTITVRTNITRTPRIPA